MFLVSLLLHAAFVIVRADSVIYEDCGSAYSLQKVSIDGCKRRLPCYVTLGEAVPVSVMFHAEFASSKLDQDVVININLINLNTEVTPEPCETVDCPVKTNALTSFTSIMSVPKQMALNQRGYLRWRVYNEKDQLVLCYSVLVQTQSPLQKKLRALLSQISSTEHLDGIVDNIELDGSHESHVTYRGYLQELIEQYYGKRTVLITGKNT